MSRGNTFVGGSSVPRPHSAITISAVRNKYKLRNFFERSTARFIVSNSLATMKGAACLIEQSQRLGSGKYCIVQVDLLTVDSLAGCG